MYLGEVPLYYDFKLLDIARVETLLGPQGTLYGLGTLAGAVRNTSQPPQYGKPRRRSAQPPVRQELHGSKAGYTMDGVINIPIVKDHIAFRLHATGYFYDPGFHRLSAAGSDAGRVASAAELDLSA